MLEGCLAINVITDCTMHPTLDVMASKSTVLEVNANDLQNATVDRPVHIRLSFSVCV
jgi:hypothetical protein